MQIALATDDERHRIAGIDAGMQRLEPTRPSAPATAAVVAPAAVDEVIVGSRDGRIVGFVELSGPGDGGYPVERYFRREVLPMAFDEGLYQVRIAVLDGSDGGGERPALSLAYAALRSIEHRGGTHIVVVARVDLIPFYRKLGLVPLELRLHAGVVEYEVMHASLLVLRRRSGTLAGQIEGLRATLDWRLPFPFEHAG